MEREKYRKLKPATKPERRAALAQMLEGLVESGHQVRRLEHALEVADEAAQKAKAELSASRSAEKALRGEVLDVDRAERVWILEDGTATAEAPDPQLTLAEQPAAEAPDAPDGGDGS